MIIYPEDWKDDNLILVSRSSKNRESSSSIINPNNQMKKEDEIEYMLVPIDNDQSFVPLFARDVEKPHKIKRQVKSIAFCVPQMNDLVDSELIDEYLKIDFSSLLMEWLIELNSLNTTFCGSLFKKSEMENYLASFDSCIPITFTRQMISKLYDRVIRLHRILSDEKERKNSGLSYFELLGYFEAE